MSMIRRGAPALLLMVAACVPAAKPPPKAAHALPPRPQPIVPEVPAQTDWRDIPLTPGIWRYVHGRDGSDATYGPADGAVFSLHCAIATHEITLRRPAPSGGAMTIRTSYSERTVLPRSGPGGMTAATFGARDPFLDQIAFSRGRFSIAGPGVPTLYLAAWAEPARVIEDCR